MRASSRTLNKLACGAARRRGRARDRSLGARRPVQTRRHRVSLGRYDEEQRLFTQAWAVKSRLASATPPLRTRSRRSLYATTCAGRSRRPLQHDPIPHRLRVRDDHPSLGELVNRAGLAGRAQEEAIAGYLRAVGFERADGRDTAASRRPTRRQLRSAPGPAVEALAMLARSPYRNGDRADHRKWHGHAEIASWRPSWYDCEALATDRRASGSPTAGWAELIPTR